MGVPSELKFLYVVHSSLDIIDEKGAEIPPPLERAFFSSTARSVD